MKVALSGADRADLKSIWKRLATEASMSTATKIASGIEDACSRLADFPESGSSRDEIRSGLRAVFYKSWVAYYLVRDGRIVVTRVVHGSRDTAALEGSGVGQ